MTLLSTKSIRCIVLTERWSKGYTREDGTTVPEGWLKPKGWPARGSQRPDGDINDFKRWDQAAYHECSLFQGLTHRASTPAYFVGYKPNTIGLRLRKDALSPLFSSFTEDGGGVEMHLFLADVDNHDENADIASWFESELDKISALQEAHPGIIVYRSRRGYRLIAALPTPIHLKSAADSNDWDRKYTAWCNYLKRKFQINADVLLDWTRFQAVPHTKKDRDQPALELQILGDVESIGVWEPNLIDEDFPAEKKASAYDGFGFEGECQLLTLVRGSGLRCEETDYANVYDICCPNWTAHSPDARGSRDYPTKTVLYTNGPIGKIECKSSGCYSSHPDRSKSYLRHFPTDAVEATRPKPPLDVWDPDVYYLACLRNSKSSKISVDEYLADESRLDTTWAVYQLALKMQRRLDRKS